MSIYSIIYWSLAYLILLFMIANWAEARRKLGKSFSNNPYVYSLSLAIYCTAWTFYGSVGYAAEQGADFLTVFLGPAITIPLWWVIFRKIIRICKVQRITNIADFISARYGKNQALGVLVTLLCVIGLIPYISIQLKAISTSFNVLANGPNDQIFIADYGWYIAIALALFTILFGIRKLETNERHEGLVTAIAFESLVKLFSFLAVGVFVTFSVYNGFDDIAIRSLKSPELAKLFDINPDNYGNWFWHCILSGFAIMFLPRQFHVTVVENTSEDHLKKALWLFPLYLLVINLFVLPIALGGKLLFASTVKADQFVLAIPLFYKNDWLALLAYIGGFSAASSMVIVECTALSVMLTNNLVMPYILSRSDWQKRYGDNVSSLVLNLRRVFVLLLLLVSYFYYRNISDRYSLVSVGLVSFAAVAQLAPSVLGGIFWKRGSRIGAMDGLIMGGLVWLYTLIIPSMVSYGLIPLSIMTDGPFGIDWLKPQSLFGLTGLDNIAHGTFWSLLFNVFFYVYGSLQFRQSALDHSQAVLFVDIFKYSTTLQNAVVWKGKALITDIRSLLVTFFGDDYTERSLQLFGQENNLNLKTQYADALVVNYAEKMLSGAIGAASARIVVASVAKEERISIEEVIDILKTSQELKNLNQALTHKSQELEQTTQQLKEANELLKISDSLKDDFLSTITHEIRTPLTSIRALSEIVHDSPDMDSDQRLYFLSTITKESERLTRLINQVLDLEHLDSGSYSINYGYFQATEMIKESLETLQQLAGEKDISISFKHVGSTSVIYADQDRLIQVMINLVSNAIKFCTTHKGHISIDSTQTETELSVSVTDNGQGIEAKYQELIFEKFYQAQDQSVRKPKGSGLGLAICKKIVELHKGHIFVESTIGKGSSFTFVIPLQHNSTFTKQT